MKELSKKTKEETAIVKQAEINKGMKFMGSQRIQKGHTMWQYNLDTGELSVAKMEAEAVMMPERDGFMGIRIPAGIVTKTKVVTKENCQYFPALNRKNAIKKLNKIGLWVKN